MRTLRPVLAFLLVLASLLWPRHAAASFAAEAETRVWGFRVELAEGLQASEPLSPAPVPGFQLPEPGTRLGFAQLVDGPNRFLFVANNPLRFVDSDGLRFFDGNLTPGDLARLSLNTAFGAVVGGAIGLLGGPGGALYGFVGGGLSGANVTLGVDLAAEAGAWLEDDPCRKEQAREEFTAYAHTALNIRLAAGLLSGVAQGLARGGAAGVPGGGGPSPTGPPAVSATARRAYLNAKFGRSGNLDLDINARGLVDAIESNATVARNLARAQVPSSAPGGTFGVRAHQHFERLNNRLRNRLAGTYRLAPEQFLDAAGRVVRGRPRGSIGADLVVDDLATNARRIFDLKTYARRMRRIGQARQEAFFDRFGARAEELYRRR